MVAVENKDSPDGVKNFDTQQTFPNRTHIVRHHTCLNCLHDKSQHGVRKPSS